MSASSPSDSSRLKVSVRSSLLNVSYGASRQPLVVRLLDVHAGNVVGQQQDVVAVQLASILALSNRSSGINLDSINLARNVPVPVKGSRTCTPLSPNGTIRIPASARRLRNVKDVVNDLSTGV